MPATVRHDPGANIAPHGARDPLRSRLRRRRRALYVALGSAAIIASLTTAAAGPILRRVARARAAALGVDLSIRDARLGFGQVTLEGVTATSPALPGLAVSLTRVVVALRFNASPRRVEVHGGNLRVNGTAGDLKKRFTAWRTAHAGPRAEGAGTGMAMSVDGVDVLWTGASPSAPPAHFWGLRYARTGGGTETVGCDLARITLAPLVLEAAGATIKVGRAGKHRVLQSVSTSRLGVAVDLDSPTRGAIPPTANADRLAPSTANPTTRADEAGTSDFGPRLRAAIAEHARDAAAWLPSSTTLELSGVHIAVRHEGQVLNVGPATIRFGGENAGAEFAVTSAASEGATPIRFDVLVPLESGPVEFGLAGGPVSLRALGVEEHDLGLEDLEHAEMAVNGHATLSADGRSLRVSGRSRFDDLSLYQPRLARDPIRGLALALAGDAEINLDGSRVHVDDLRVDVGKVKLHAEGELTREGGHATGRLHVDIPLAACSDMLASTPTSLVPLLAGLQVKGTYALSSDLAFDTRRPGDTRVDWTAVNECRIDQVPGAIAPERFSRPWERTVLGPGRVPMTIESGPGTSNWVPLLDISPFLATAVVVCEDASFWVHHGFNEKSIRDSIRDDLRAGKFLRGASTVSMQLAKNLYLPREKTLSRKLQEAVLTMLLEQSLTKEQILELYLNVIEFAPGLYGIGPAATHYFRSVPRDLSLAQAFYLVSILPNPKVHHFSADGTLSPRWTEYLRHLMDIAHKIHKIDDQELAAGLAETVRFGVPSASAEADDSLGAGIPEPGPSEGEPEDDGP